MNRNRVGKFRMDENENQADITLLDDNAVVMIPKSYVVKQDANGNDIPLLAPGDRFTILQDKDGNYHVAFDTRAGHEEFSGTRADVLVQMTRRVKRILHVR